MGKFKQYGEYMPSHTRSRLRSEGSGSRKGERAEETADMPRLSRQKVKGTKTGKGSVPRVSVSDSTSVMTDADAVDTFNRVLLKKIHYMSQSDG